MNKLIVNGEKISKKINKDIKILINEKQDI